MRVNANWLWLAVLIMVLMFLWTEGAFGQETPHPSKMCQHQWVFQPDLLPNLKDPNLVKEAIKFGGFTYFFYTDKRSKKVKVVIAHHSNVITGEVNENWTWQDEDMLITTVPKLKWNFCMIMMKKYKGKILDLTHLKEMMLKGN